jgi:hypothetical protein
MAGFSQALAQSIFDATLAASRSSLSAKPGVWMSLHTAAPNDASGGNEATYTGYARVNIASLMTSSVVGTAPEQTVRATNTGDINFPASTGATQTVTHWAIWSDQTLGTSAYLMYSGELSSSRAVQAGDVVVIPAGQLQIDLT